MCEALEEVPPCEESARLKSAKHAAAAAVGEDVTRESVLSDPRGAQEQPCRQALPDRAVGVDALDRGGIEQSLHRTVA